ncbi:DUF3618 domain-containing protein [Histidinibacterium lentulum]|uniref:DUF3618 domain-containing protein n=1 Tax=Histidinibacterium lentulum TaxID=2480588 RepID=A0A3N2R8K6_9RHOB|nr:DUF3618 domain-containing protein [Histidinibacterium lentulum]ROU03743.1 DUF3618 domain-containing protein [Histidinibacterium lentulum]
MTEQKPEQIEREIEDERRSLAHTLDRLQARFTPEALVQRAEDRLRDDGGALMKGLQRRIAANPVATAVTTAGLAWLLFGPTKDEQRAWRMRHGTVPRGAAFERHRARAAAWLLSHDPDPDRSLRLARDKVAPEVAEMIDRLEFGTDDMPPEERARVRRARLRAISSRMAARRMRGRRQPARI